MKFLVASLHRSAERVGNFFAYLGFASTLMLVLVITYGVFMRFVIGKPQSWTDQVAEYSLLWIVFFGLGYTMLKGGHVRMELAVANMPASLKRWFSVFAHCVGLVFAIGLFLGTLSNSGVFFTRSTTAMSGIPIQLWIPTVPMLFGSLAFVWVLLCRLLLHLFDPNSIILHQSRESEL